MQLPLTPRRRVGGLTAALAAGAALAAVLLSSQAGAAPVSPGPEAARLPDEPATEASGTGQPVTPGVTAPPTTPPAAPVTTPTSTPTTSTPTTSTPTTATPTATAPAGGAPASAPTAAPLANTGPIDMRLALFGFVLTAAGLIAVATHHRIPLPVILEFERASATRETAP